MTTPACPPVMGGGTLQTGLATVLSRVEQSLDEGFEIRIRRVTEPDEQGNVFVWYEAEAWVNGHRDAGPYIKPTSLIDALDALTRPWYED